MNFIHPRAFMSKIFTLTNFIREFNLSTMLISDPSLILRIRLIFLSKLIFMFILLIILFTIIFFVVLRWYGLHHNNFSGLIRRRCFRRAKHTRWGLRCKNKFPKLINKLADGIRNRPNHNINMWFRRRFQSVNGRPRRNMKNFI